jgi:hypothetical protein
VTSGPGPVGGAAKSKLVRGIDVPGPSSTDVVIVREGGVGLGGAGPDLDGSPADVSGAEVGGVAGAAVVLGLKYR